MEDKIGGGPTDEHLFIHLVMMFQVAAMQQLGKVMNPVTNKIERDLDQAKFSIDTISMLKAKTKGNLTPQEEEYLGKVLFELQMNYVDELDRAKEEGKESKEKPKQPQAGAEEEPAIAEEKTAEETPGEEKPAEENKAEKQDSTRKASAKKAGGAKASAKARKKPKSG